jgi:hypothetical protein
MDHGLSMPVSSRQKRDPMFDRIPVDSAVPIMCFAAARAQQWSTRMRACGARSLVDGEHGGTTGTGNGRSMVSGVLNRWT